MGQAAFSQRQLPQQHHQELQEREAVRTLLAERLRLKGAEFSDEHVDQLSRAGFNNRHALNCATYRWLQDAGLPPRLCKVLLAARYSHLPLYSTTLAERYDLLLTPAGQWGLYVTAGGGAVKCTQYMRRASMLKQAAAATDPEMKLELKELGRFTETDLAHAARVANRLRLRGLAIGIGAPALFMGYWAQQHS